MPKKSDSQEPEVTAPASEPKADEQLPTIEELAKKHGQVMMISYKTKGGKTVTDIGTPVAGDNPYSAAHQSAAVLNGWERVFKLTHQPVRMSDADYLAAIDAAKIGKDHPPANLRSQLPPMGPPPDASNRRWFVAAKATKGGSR